MKINEKNIIFLKKFLKKVLHCSNVSTIIFDVSGESWIIVVDTTYNLKEGGEEYER